MTLAEMNDEFGAVRTELPGVALSLCCHKLNAAFYIFYDLRTSGLSIQQMSSSV